MEFHRALADISALRNQLARSTAFRGYGPATIACTGLLAFGAALLQTLTLKDPGHNITGYLQIWIATAAIAVAMIGGETIPRTLRLHATLGREMMRSAAMHFLPPVCAAVMLTAVLLHSAPQSSWMLPGLWQVLFSLGVFSSCRLLPRQVIAVGLWYFVAGLICLAGGDADRALSGWAMGIPFGVGQLLVAGILYLHYRKSSEGPSQQA